MYEIINKMVSKQGNRNMNNTSEYPTTNTQDPFLVIHSSEKEVVKGSKRNDCFQFLPWLFSLPHENK